MEVLLILVPKDHNQKHILFPSKVAKEHQCKRFTVCEKHCLICAKFVWSEVKSVWKLDFWNKMPAILAKKCRIISLPIQRKMHLSDRLLLFQVKNPLNRSQSVYDNWLDKFPASDGRTPKWVIQHYYSGTTPFYIKIATLLLQPIYAGVNKSSLSQTFSLLKHPSFFQTLRLFWIVIIILYIVVFVWLSFIGFLP